MLARYFDFSFGSNFCFFPAGGSDKSSFASLPQIHTGSYLFFYYIPSWVWDFSIKQFLVTNLLSFAGHHRVPYNRRSPLLSLHPFDLSSAWHRKGQHSLLKWWPVRKPDREVANDYHTPGQWYQKRLLKTCRPQKSSKFPTSSEELLHLITLLSTQLDKHLVYFGSIIDWQQSIQALLLIPKALFTSLSLPKQKGIFWLKCGRVDGRG